jgi:hypothetical protein
MHNKETYEDLARAHAVHKMHLQAIGTLVVRQLVKDGAINIEKLQDAAMDLRLVDLDANDKFIAVPIVPKNS